MLIFLNLLIRLLSRFAVFICNSVILFGIIFYLACEHSILDCLHHINDWVNIILFCYYPDSHVLKWLTEKVPLRESEWLVNKGIPFIIFIYLETYFYLIYFGYLRQVNPSSTKVKLSQNHGCALRFWLGFQNSCFSLAISCLFTINSFLVLINTQFGAAILIALLLIAFYFLILPMIIELRDTFSPTIGVALANSVVLGYYFCGFSQYARMLWLAQLVCVCGVALFFLILSPFFNPTLSTKFVQHMTRKIRHIRKNKMHALMHQKYLSRYLAAINTPKLWLLVAQFFEYTNGLWATEINQIADPLFFSICVLANMAFIPAIAYTHTGLYRVLPPISFWLRFEISTIHYLKLLWASYGYFNFNKQPTIRQKLHVILWHIGYYPYKGYQADQTVIETTNTLEANAYFVLMETDNPNKIAYRSVTSATGLLFQILIAYYLLGVSLI